MLSPSDLLHLPYTPDLTEGGIAHALRSLPYLLGNERPYDRIRRMVAGVAAELAFRRHLSAQDIPFEVNNSAPFSDSERYTVSLGGRRCNLESFFISNRAQAIGMRRDPSMLLGAPALVASDHHPLEDSSDHDLYLFAFISGLVAASQSDLGRVAETRQPLHLTHILPPEWRRPAAWRPFGSLTLKSETTTEITVEISGQDAELKFLMQEVSLPPQKRVTIANNFHSITALHARQIPAARLGIHSPSLGRTHVIPPLEWRNIWVYGMEIYLAGYITRAEFRRRASPIPIDSKVFQYSRTKAKNMAVPVSGLKPMHELLARAKDQAAK